MAADMTPAVDSVSGSAGSSDGATGGAERGAGGVVFDARGRVLLLRHAAGAWVFPKGHLEPGETELQAALREVEEEAGVRASCADETARWSTRYVNPRGTLRQITWFALDSDEPAAVSEALFTEAGYFAVGEAEELLTHDEDKRLLAAIVASGHGGER